MAPGGTWWLRFCCGFPCGGLIGGPQNHQKIERSPHRVTPRLLLLGVVTPSDGTLQLYTGPRRVVFWPNWRFGPTVNGRKSTEGGIEEELSIDGSISFTLEKGDWTWQPRV